MHDVLIIGGGPSGSLAAYHLSRHGAHVALVEKKQFPRVKLCGGGVSTKASRLLDGIVDLNKLSGRTVTGSYLSFRGERLAYIGHQAPARSINRHEFDQALLGAAKEAGCEVLMPEEAVGIIERSREVTVELRGGRSVAGRYLILAAGVNGKLHEQLGYQGTREMTMALEVDLRPAQYPAAFRHNALFEFGSITKGYGWVFPKDEFLNIGAYYRRSPKIDRDQQRELDVFRNRFAWAREAEAGTVKGHAVPYRFSYRSFNTGRTLLVGDAAGAVENFFGEGIFYGLLSGKLAAETLGDVFGKRCSLERYDRRLRRAVLSQIRYSRLTARLFYDRQRFGYYHMVRNTLMNRIYAGLIDGSRSHRLCLISTLLGLPLAALAGNLPEADLAEIGLGP